MPPMPASFDPYTDITPIPSMKMPSIERLQGRRDPPNNLDNQVRLMHASLRRISIEAQNCQDGKGKEIGCFQRLSFTPGSKDRTSARVVTHLVMHVCEQFARARDHLVRFRVKFIARPDGTMKDVEKHVRVVVDPSRLDDPEDDDEEDDDADDEDFEDDEGDEDPEESEDDEEDDENDDDESDEQDDDDYAAEQPETRRPVARVPRDSATPYVDRSLMGPLESPVEIHSAVHQAQRMGLQPDFSAGVPLQNNIVFLLQVIERQNATCARIWADQAREQRRDRRLMRREFSTTAREMRRMAAMVVKQANEQRDLALNHAQNLGQQLIDITELRRENHENYQRIAAHSWKAFRHAMEQEMTMASTLMRYERQLFDERLARAETTQESAPSQWPSMLTHVLPMGMGFMAHLMKKRGHEDLSEMFRNMANTMAARMSVDEDDEDDDEAEEQDEHLGARVVDTDAKEEPARPRTDEYAHPSPTRDSARALLETIDREQATALRKALPKGAWDAFEQTASAKTESTARVMVRRLDELVRKDVAAQAGVMQILRGEQTKQLFEIIRIVERKRVPPRPRADEAATG